MAKYDQFKVSEKFAVGVSEGEVELSVLFEDGDDIASVMLAAQSRLDTHVSDENVGGGGNPTPEGAIAYLESLTPDQVRGVCRQYWIAQMNLLGGQKDGYARDLKDDVKFAENNSN